MENSPQFTDRLIGVIRAQEDIANLGLDLGSVMSLVTQRALVLTPATGAVIELAEGDELVYRATSGLAAPHLGLRLRRENSLSGLCIAKEQMIVCVDAEEDSRVDKDACRLIGLRSMIVVPLRHDTNVVGVLKVYSPTPNMFDESDERILDLMSGLIASAMFHSTQSDAAALFHRATHDPLTGLANRALFYDRLRHSVVYAKRERQNFAVVSLDMDGLKGINDTFGHRVGDAVIVEVAQRLSHVGRESDTVARIGGDEFGVILACPSERQAIEAYAKRLANEMKVPFDFEGREIALSVSSGVAVFPLDGQDITGLVDTADSNMYVAKRSQLTS